AAAPNLAVVLTPDFQYGDLTLHVETWARPFTPDDRADFRGHIAVAGHGLRVSSVDDRGKRVDVADGSYDFAISHVSTAELPQRWRLDLFQVSVLAARKRTQRPARKDTPAAREKRRQNLVDRLADRSSGFVDLSRLALQNGYNDLLDDLAPTIAGPSAINLYRTGITDLPQWLRKVTGLVQLLAHDNQLTTAPDWMTELSHLGRLALSYNRDLRTVPPVIAHIPALVHLDVIDAGLTEFPDTLRPMSALRHLTLNDNAITRIPDWINELTGLRVLHLAGLPIKALPDTIGDLRNLEELYLDNTALTTLPETMVNLPRLRTVWLGRSPITDIPAAVLDHFPEDVIDDRSTPFGKRRHRC
ncbi:MAG: protein scribble, partial [Frankiaceae bacterium]|nr:protein scribble [Frankiaceae bacterium]